MIHTILANQSGLLEGIRALVSEYTHNSPDMPSNDEDDQVSAALPQEDAAMQDELGEAGAERHGAVPIKMTAEATDPQATFIEELHGSRVYQKVSSQSSGATRMAFMTRMTPWSELSGHSIADVSTISSVKLPIHARDGMQIETFGSEASIAETSKENRITRIAVNPSQQSKRITVAPFQLSKRITIEGLGQLLTVLCTRGKQGWRAKRVRLIYKVRAALEAGSEIFKVMRLHTSVFALGS